MVCLGLIFFAWGHLVGAETTDPTELLVGIQGGEFARIRLADWAITQIGCHQGRAFYVDGVLFVGELHKAVAVISTTLEMGRTSP